MRQAGAVQQQRTAPGTDGEGAAGGPGRSLAVVLLGAAGAGKSTLAAALLAALGAPPPLAPAPGALAAGRYALGGTEVWLLDPPGAPDLAGALHTGLRVAGAAVLVVSPVQGVDARTVAVWEALEHLPRVVVLTALDRPGADADEAVAVCQRVLGDGVLPLQLPLHDDDGSVGGLLDLLHLRVSDGPERRAADPEHATLVEGLRAELLEAVLTGSDDEQLFDRFLDDEEPPSDVLTHELSRAVGHGDLQPVLVAAPRRGVGLHELAVLLAGLAPGSTRVPSATTAAGAPVDLVDGTPVAELVAPGLVRVWSGTLRPGPVLVAGRPGTWAGPLTGEGTLVAGDLEGAPGDAVSTVPLVLAPWDAPAAQFPVGAPDDADLARRVGDDPVARLETDPRTGQLLLWTYGPEHAEALLDGLPAGPVRVPPGARPVAVVVRVPAWAERAVRSDATTRGGEVVGSAPSEEGVVLQVRLPPAELPGYAVALGRATAHTGSFTRA